MRINTLFISLLQRFCWLDDGLQARLSAEGWPNVSRPQSMVMMNIVSGIVRPSDIARNMGISRQAVHNTINQMVKMDMVKLTPDPDDRRHMLLSLTATGEAMRQDAQRSMDSLGDQLLERLGPERFHQLIDILRDDWGDCRPDAKPTDT
jgi:DNA-binding MarR family transcriptional regulator